MKGSKVHVFQEILQIGVNLPPSNRAAYQLPLKDVILDSNFTQRRLQVKKYRTKKQNTILDTILIVKNGKRGMRPLPIIIKRLLGILRMRLAITFWGINRGLCKDRPNNIWTHSGPTKDRHSQIIWGLLNQEMASEILQKRKHHAVHWKRRKKHMKFAHSSYRKNQRDYKGIKENNSLHHCSKKDRATFSQTCQTATMENWVMYQVLVWKIVVSLRVLYRIVKGLTTDHSKKIMSSLISN